MADKKSFLMYKDWTPMLKGIPREKLGDLMYAILCFQDGDTNIVPEDPMVAAMFSMIKAVMAEDDEKYEVECQKRSEAGKKGNEKRWGKQSQSDSDISSATEKIANVASVISATEKIANVASAISATEKIANVAEYDNEYDNDFKKKMYPTDTQKKKRTEDEKLTKAKSANKGTYTPAFEEMWDYYPRKEGKGDAYKKYKARLNDGYSEDELLTAVKNYADTCKARSTEPQYIKHCKTFFSDSLPFVDYLRGGISGGECARDGTVRSEEYRQQIRQSKTRLDFE